jgi:hypothetical protein
MPLFSTVVGNHFCFLVAAIIYMMQRRYKKEGKNRGIFSD